MKYLKLATTLLALSLSALAPATARAGDMGFLVRTGGVAIDIGIGVPPPPSRVQVVPAGPVGYVWIPGYWGWDGYRYFWVEGAWARQRPGYAYVPGRWEHHEERWHYAPGRWEGQRWHGDHRRHEDRWERDGHRGHGR